jgi:hypothetical protein
MLIAWLLITFKLIEHPVSGGGLTEPMEELIVSAHLTVFNLVNIQSLHTWAVYGNIIDRFQIDYMINCMQTF